MLHRVAEAGAPILLLEVASLGGQARQRSLLAARHLLEKLLYAAAVAQLQGEAREVLRMKTIAGPLPGLYERRS